jgi:hypothetical protein
MPQYQDIQVVVMRKGNYDQDEQSRRNELYWEFVAAVYEEWQQHGDGVLEELRKNDPVTYGRLVNGAMDGKLRI